MIEASISGLDVTLTGIEEWGVRTKAYAIEGVAMAVLKAEEIARVIIGVQDHSLKDLADMGHPYKLGGSPPHDTPLVHEQTGEYKSHLRVDMPRGYATEIIQGKLYNDDPKDRFIQDGTTKMIARPWMEYLVTEYGEDLANIIRERILAGLAAA